ncbi:MAG: hypothetical protein A3G93_03440 [Nitrospinae bacterium RIFCSPLOWO2_12_FULL_45_22]|nr:MAG: hypothetical protein A3G93_03440 [Nitrospinae bacterium RIFCSPLOWO2_12_FULL_45_22]
MKVVLIYPDIIPGIAFYEGHYSQAVGLLSALIRKENHQATLIHITRDMVEEEFCQQVWTENPDLMAFTCTSNSFPLVKKMISWLRRHNFGILTICGGPHVTLNPHDVISNKDIDIICVGEGDEALRSLCSKLDRGEDYSRISNLWLKSRGEIIKNPLSPYIDVNKLPPADRKIFPNYRNLMWERLGRATVMASRGCPYQCHYCCNHVLKKVGGVRNYTRFRSVKHLIDELINILADFSFINSFHFDDDNLFLDMKWFSEFSSIYNIAVRKPYSCNMRPNLLNEKTVKMLAESGCDMIQMGIESGNEVIRNRVLNRGLSEETIVKAFVLCRASGIKVHANNMIGIPLESAGAVLDTIKLNSRVKPDSTKIFIFYPYKGTVLYDICVERNYLTERDSIDYFTDSVLSLPDLSREQIIMFRGYFRIFMRLYGAAHKFKGVTGTYLVHLIDKILSLNSLARVMAGLYPIFRWLWLRIIKRSYKSFSYPIKVEPAGEVFLWKPKKM